MTTSYRTHTCGELRLSDAGKEVTLAGWTFRIRSFGSMIFIDLRDRYGWTQLVFDEAIDAELCKLARHINREDVLQVTGVVRERINKNPDIPTGDIEVVVNTFRILSHSETPPFTLENQTDGGEELRMRYRYLDLRRPIMRDTIIFRHQVAQYVRQYLSKNNFLEIETPFLIKSTPEGARDFVVPSRLFPGSFFALPQSPQTFKQLLMIAGFDRYFQIVRCFRDEDFRADRQPEFTQIDCEMSFVSQEDVMMMFESLIRFLFEKMLNVQLTPFPRLSYDEAISRYGTDRPDLRFDMPIYDLTSFTCNTEFAVLRNAEYIGALCIKGGNSLSRKNIDELTDFVRQPQVGGNGLVWVRWNEDDTLKSSVDKFFAANDLRQWFIHCNGNKGDLLLIAAGEALITQKVLGALRLKVAEMMNIIPKKSFAPCWIVDFPLLEYDTEEQRYIAMHHPFTAPKPDHIELLWSEPSQVRAQAYDMVINGVEIGGGSIRIHEQHVQQQMFSLLGLTQEQTERQFGFFLQAFQYGVPPHGGIAFGFDRLIALMLNKESIRDTIAFPKSSHGKDLMLDAPAPIDKHQLDELHIALKIDKQ